MRWPSGFFQATMNARMDRLPLSILQHPWGGSNSAVQQQMNDKQNVVSTYNEVLSLKKEQNSDKWYNTDECENMLNEISWTQTVWVHLHEVPRRGKFTDRNLIRGKLEVWGRRGMRLYLMYTDFSSGVIKNFKEWLYDNESVLHAQSLQSRPALWRMDWITWEAHDLSGKNYWDSHMPPPGNLPDPRIETAALQR